MNTPRTDEAAYSMGRSGEHRDIERWCDLLNESRKLEDELTAVTEQRDRLAEALKECREDSISLISFQRKEGYHKSIIVTEKHINDATEALQSLNQPTP